MKKKIAALAAGGLVVLAGCAAEPEQQDSDYVQELESEVADLESQVRDLQAQLQEQEQQDEQAEEGDILEDDIEEEPGNGDLTALGESVEVMHWSGGPLGHITLNEIEHNYTDPACEDDEWVDPPESGEFVALHLTLEAADEMVEGWDEWIILEDDFYLIDVDSNLVRDDLHTFGAWDCAYESGDQLENPPAGTTTSGVVLLDTALDQGTLVFAGGEQDVRWDFDR